MASSTSGRKSKKIDYVRNRRRVAAAAFSGVSTVTIAIVQPLQSALRRRAVRVTSFQRAQTFVGYSSKLKIISVIVYLCSNRPVFSCTALIPPYVLQSSVRGL